MISELIEASQFASMSLTLETNFGDDPLPS